eukprot:1929497-Pleurochrysis_carterae.AAC.2
MALMGKAMDTMNQPMGERTLLRKQNVAGVAHVRSCASSPRLRVSLLLARHFRRSTPLVLAKYCFSLRYLECVPVWRLLLIWTSASGPFACPLHMRRRRLVLTKLLLLRSWWPGLHLEAFEPWPTSPLQLVACHAHLRQWLFHLSHFEIPGSSALRAACLPPPPSKPSITASVNLLSVKETFSFTHSKLAECKGDLLLYSHSASVGFLPVSVPQACQLPAAPSRCRIGLPAACSAEQVPHWLGTATVECCRLLDQSPAVCGLRRAVVECMEESSEMQAVYSDVGSRLWVRPLRWAGRGQKEQNGPGDEAF